MPNGRPPAARTCSRINKTFNTKKGSLSKRKSVRKKRVKLGIVRVPA